MIVKKLDKFTDEAKRGLAVAMGEDSEFLIDEVNQNRSHLYQVENNSWLITRAEIVNQKKEFVIVAFEGKDVIKVTNWLVKKARSLGFDTVRAHTSIKKFGDIIEKKIGAKLVEKIYRLELNNG